MYYCTKHFNDRVQQRRFSKQEVLNTLKQGSSVMKGNNELKMLNGVTIVLSENRLITIYRSK